MTQPNGGGMMPSDPLDRLMVESISQACTDIRATLARYIVMPEPYLDFLPIWVAHTYCLDVLQLTPYLVIYSPTMRSGKTRLLEILEQFTWKGWLVSDLSGPSIFRKLKEERVTMLIDEADAMTLPQRTRNVLNTGYRAGGKVVRLNSKNKPEEYPTYGAKAFAGIGKVLPATVMDRSVPLILMRKRKDEHVDPYRGTDIRDLAEKAQNAMVGLPMIFGTEIARPRSDMPKWMSDRKRESLEGLFTIAELIGWGKRFRDACQAILQDDEYEDDVDTASLLLGDIRKVLNEHTGDKIGTEELREKLRNLDDGSYDGDALGSKHRLTFEIRKFNIRPQQLWIPDRNAPKGGHNVRGYTKGMFKDAFARYLD